MMSSVISAFVLFVSAFASAMPQHTSPNASLRVGLPEGWIELPRNKPRDGDAWCYHDKLSGAFVLAGIQSGRFVEPLDAWISRSRQAGHPVIQGVANKTRYVICEVPDARAALKREMRNPAERIEDLALALAPPTGVSELIIRAAVQTAGVNALLSMSAWIDQPLQRERVVAAAVAVLERFQTSENRGGVAVHQSPASQPPPVTMQQLRQLDLSAALSIDEVVQQLGPPDDVERGPWAGFVAIYVVREEGEPEAPICLEFNVDQRLIRKALRQPLR